MWFGSWYDTGWFAGNWWDTSVVPPVDATSYGTGNVRQWDHLKQLLAEDEELIAILTA